MLARGQDSLQREKASLRQQSAASTPNRKTSITCDAAGAVVADFGFQGVKPEQCEDAVRSHPGWNEICSRGSGQRRTHKSSAITVIYLIA
jgi:hypothetical protein